VLEQAGGVQIAERGRPARVRQHHLKLHLNPLGADPRNAGGAAAHGSPGGRFDLESEAGGESDRAEHPQVVFGEAPGGPTDGADEAGVQVVLAADKVDQTASEGVVEHAVDREVASEGVLACGRKANAVRSTAVLIVFIDAEGGDLDPVPADADEDDAELHPNLSGAAEQRHDSIRAGVGGDVVVLGPPVHFHVAHAAAGEEGLVAGVAEPPQDAEGCLSHGQGRRTQGSSRHNVLSAGGLRNKETVTEPQPRRSANVHLPGK